MSRPPLPPFTDATAREKVRIAEDGWVERVLDAEAPGEVVRALGQ